MTTTHHPDDATLMRYASGALDEAFSVVVATHLEVCETCRSGVKAAESCGGHFLETSEPSQLDQNALNRLKASLEATELKFDQLATTPMKRAQVIHAVSKTLQRYLGHSIEEVPWSSVAPGVRKFDIKLKSQSNAHLYMLHIGPGRTMPDHGHDGQEMTLVLRGSFSDVHGKFQRGDVADLDEHDEHQPVVEQGEPCICLIAAEGYSKPKGLVARLLQPFIKI